MLHLKYFNKTSAFPFFTFIISNTTTQSNSSSWSYLYHPQTRTCFLPNTLITSLPTRQYPEPGSAAPMRFGWKQSSPTRDPVFTFRRRWWGGVARIQLQGEEIWELYHYLVQKQLPLCIFFLLVFSFYFFSSFLTGMSPVDHTARM